MLKLINYRSLDSVRRNFSTKIGDSFKFRGELYKKAEWDQRTRTQQYESIDSEDFMTFNLSHWTKHNNKIPHTVIYYKQGANRLLTEVSTVGKN